MIWAKAMRYNIFQLYFRQTASRRNDYIPPAFGVVLYLALQGKGLVNRGSYYWNSPDYNFFFSRNFKNYFHSRSIHHTPSVPRAPPADSLSQRHWLATLGALAGETLVHLPDALAPRPRTHGSCAHTETPGSVRWLSRVRASTCVCVIIILIGNVKRRRRVWVNRGT